MAKHNIMLRATALHNVVGRVDYISNPKRQEHLVATYSTTDDPSFWRALQKHCDVAAADAGHEHGIGGREFMGALPNEFAELDPQELAEWLSGQIKKVTKTENITAVHWNKQMNNFHFHTVVSENLEINEITYGAELTRNTYYNAKGKRSTKKECVDPVTGKLRKGCKMYKKGEKIENVKRFGHKQEYIGEKAFTRMLKYKLSKEFNAVLQEERFQRFENGLYLAQQHIGKNTTIEQQNAIQAKNKLVRAYNVAVDENIELIKHCSVAEQEREREMLEKRRNDIKKYAQSADWIHAIQFHLTRIRERIKAIKKVFWQQMPLEQKQAAAEKIQSGKQSHAPKKKKEEPER